MGMSEFYGPRDDAESITTIQRAIELGIDFFDTADMYGPFINEELLGRALRAKRDQVVIATEFGNVRGKDGSFKGIDGSPEYVRACAAASLRRLGIDTTNLYYQHRVDTKVPIEDTVCAMSDLVKAGKVRYLSLSEAAAATIERAHRVHPISALQSEYSLWSREPEDELLPLVRRLGIGFVAYGPLGRGLLTGQINQLEDLAADDRRRMFPRFSGDNFTKNLQRVDRIRELAPARKVSPAQLALAWVLAQGKDIVPIPGTKRRQYLEENVSASSIELGAAELAKIAEVAPKNVAAGDRYPDMRTVNR